MTMISSLQTRQPQPHAQAGGSTNSQPPPLQPPPGNGNGNGSGPPATPIRPNPSPSPSPTTVPNPTQPQPQPGTPTIAPSPTDSVSAVCPRLPTDPAPTSAVQLTLLVPDWTKSACTSPDRECALTKALVQLGPDTSWSAWALQGCFVAVPPTAAANTNANANANVATASSDVIWACSSKQTIVGPAVPATFPNSANSSPSAPCSMNCGSHGLPKRMPGKQPTTTINPDSHLLLLHGCLSKINQTNSSNKCAWLDLDSSHVASGLNRSMVDQGLVPALACTSDSGASIVVSSLDEQSGVAPPAPPPTGGDRGGADGGNEGGGGLVPGKVLPWVAGSLGVIAAAGLLLLAAVRYRRHRRNRHHGDEYYYTTPPGGGRRSRRSSRTRTSAYDRIHASTQDQLARTSHLPVRPNYPPPPIPIHHPHHLANQHHHDSSFTSSTSSSNPLLHPHATACHSNIHHLPLPTRLSSPPLPHLPSLQSLVDEWTSIFLALEHLYRVPAASLSLGVTRTRAVRAYLLTLACSQLLERAGFDPHDIPRPLPLAWLAPHAVPRLSRRALAEEQVLVERVVGVLAQVRRVRNRGMRCSVIGPGEVPEKGWVVYLQQEEEDEEVGLGMGQHQQDVELAPWVVAGTVWPGWVEEDAGQVGGVRVIVPARLYLVREWLDGQ